MLRNLNYEMKYLVCFEYLYTDQIDKLIDLSWVWNFPGPIFLKSHILFEQLKRIF